jgi:predicted phosphodiesterase
VVNSTSDAWNFAVLGDSRQQWGYWDDNRQHYSHDNSSNPTRAALMNSIVENNPNLEFIIHTGDMVTNGGEQEDWDRFFEDIENATKNEIPFYYAVGNHEYYTYALGPSQWAPPDENLTTYLANVDLPGNERYYSFDYKNQIHFVFLNTDEDWADGFEITSYQKSWLIHDLEENTIDFVVAVFHRPCYSVRDSNRVDDAKSVRTVLKPLFLKHGVDLVFSGHDHYYYRTTRDEITFITIAGGGAELYSNNDPSEMQVGDKFFSQHHYCNVTVNEVEGKFIVKIDTLIFFENTRSTTLGDSFQIVSQVSSSTTSKRSTFFSFFTVLFGVSIIILQRKK